MIKGLPSLSFNGTHLLVPEIQNYRVSVFRVQLPEPITSTITETKSKTVTTTDFSTITPETTITQISLITDNIIITQTTITTETESDTPINIFGGVIAMILIVTLRNTRFAKSSSKTDGKF